MKQNSSVASLPKEKNPVKGKATQSSKENKALAKEKASKKSTKDKITQPYSTPVPDLNYLPASPVSVQDKYMAVDWSLNVRVTLLSSVVHFTYETARGRPVYVVVHRSMFLYLIFKTLRICTYQLS